MDMSCKQTAITIGRVVTVDIFLFLGASWAIVGAILGCYFVAYSFSNVVAAEDFQSSDLKNFCVGLGSASTCLVAIGKLNLTNGADICEDTFIAGDPRCCRLFKWLSLLVINWIFLHLTLFCATTLNISYYVGLIAIVAVAIWYPLRACGQCVCPSDKEEGGDQKVAPKPINLQISGNNNNDKDVIQRGTSWGQHLSFTTKPKPKKLTFWQRLEKYLILSFAFASFTIGAAWIFWSIYDHMSVIGVGGYFEQCDSSSDSAANEEFTFSVVTGFWLTSSALGKLIGWASGVGDLSQFVLFSLFCTGGCCIILAIMASAFYGFSTSIAYIISSAVLYGGGFILLVIWLTMLCCVNEKERNNYIGKGQDFDNNVLYGEADFAKQDYKSHWRSQRQLAQVKKEEENDKDDINVNVNPNPNGADHNL